MQEKETEVTDLLWGIEDTNKTWDTQMDRINVKLHDKAVAHGLRQDVATTHFELFDILDMVKTASTCKQCWDGTKCTKHAFARREAVRPTVKEDRNLKFRKLGEERAAREKASAYE